MSALTSLTNNVIYIMDEYIKAIEYINTLESDITRLDLSTFLLTFRFPDLRRFTNLTYLDISNTKVNNITNLPPTLKVFICSGNYLLTQLPELPSGLDVLICTGSQITTFPVFPKTLRYFNCDYCHVKLLNELPPNLVYLSACHTKLIRLPILPDKIEVVQVNGCIELKTIPLIPESVICFNCYMTCFYPILYNLFGNFYNTRQVKEYSKAVYNLKYHINRLNDTFIWKFRSRFAEKMFSPDRLNEYLKNIDDNDDLEVVLNNWGPNIQYKSNTVYKRSNDELNDALHNIGQKHDILYYNTEAKRVDLIPELLYMYDNDNYQILLAEQPDNTYSVEQQAFDNQYFAEQQAFDDDYNAFLAEEEAHEANLDYAMQFS